MENISGLFIDHMPKIESYRGDFISFNNMLKKTTLTGKISCLSIAENLFEYMEQTQGKFSELQDSLLDVLTKESVKNAYISLESMAQVAIDVLIRNLFERTADVGFLATDEDLRNFIQNTDKGDEDKSYIAQRLKEYVAKYSVYDEIVIVDREQKVVAHLNSENTPNGVKSAFAAKALACSSEYLEGFVNDSIADFKEKALLYGCPIKKSDGNDEVIGALLLSFKFKNEMSGIFEKLIQGAKNTYIALVDADKNVVATSSSGKLPLGSKISLISLGGQYKGMNIGNKVYLVASAKTIGYQGYFGPNWEACIFVKIDDALKFGSGADLKIDQDELRGSTLIHEDLKEIIADAENINEDLSDVVINGEIIASKTRSYSLNPILDNIRTISENINSVCLNSIDDLLKSVIDSYMESVKFYASLAIDIMDRNLYERANDCRWWALDGRLREIFEKQEFTAEKRNEMTDILRYINNLYTVYTNLFVFDTSGVVQAVSNEKDSSLVGKQLNLAGVSSLFSNTNTQKYFVSQFDKTPLYGDTQTYIYYATILNRVEPYRAVGGIGIVFDSAPQFNAMLLDSLPKDDSGCVVKNSFALFIDKNKKIISSTDEKYKIGEALDIDDALLEKGAKGSSRLISMGGKKYIVGVKKSFGYREYKVNDGYKNDIFAVVFVEMG